jgi:hypothetical protein
VSHREQVEASGGQVGWVTGVRLRSRDAVRDLADRDARADHGGGDGGGAQGKAAQV